MLGVHVRAYEWTATGTSYDVAHDQRVVGPRRLAASPTH
jgi:hypothetical protein